MVMPLTAVVGWLWPVAEYHHSCSLLPTSRKTERIGKAKARKLLSQDEQSLSERKKKNSSHINAITLCLPQAGSKQQLSWKTKPHLLSPLFWLLRTMVQNGLFAHFRSAVPSVSLPNSLFHPLLRWVGYVRVRKSLHPVQALSSTTQNTGVLLTLF